MKVYAEFVPNRNVVLLHTDLEMTGPNHIVKACYLNPEYKILEDLIGRVYGVESVELNRFKISITKATAFDWQDMIIKIQSVLKSFFSGTDVTIDMERFSVKDDVVNLNDDIERKLDQVIKLLSDIGGVLDGKLGLIVNSGNVQYEALEAIAQDLNNIKRRN